MKSRRLISRFQAGGRHPITSNGGCLRHSKPDRPMSALGQKQTSRHLQPMSALPKSGHPSVRRGCLLCAKSRLMHCSKKRPMKQRNYIRELNLLNHACAVRLPPALGSAQSLRLAFGHRLAPSRAACAQPPAQPHFAPLRRAL